MKQRKPREVFTPRMTQCGTVLIADREFKVGNLLCNSLIAEALLLEAETFCVADGTVPLVIRDAILLIFSIASFAI